VAGARRVGLTYLKAGGEASDSANRSWVRLVVDSAPERSRRIEHVEEIAFAGRVGRCGRPGRRVCRAGGGAGGCAGRHADLQRVGGVGLRLRLDARPRLHLLRARPGRILPRPDRAVRRRYRLHAGRRPDLDRGRADRDAAPGRPRRDLWRRDGERHGRDRYRRQCVDRRQQQHGRAAAAQPRGPARPQRRRRDRRRRTEEER
jgi:hypothetical protein